MEKDIIYIGANDYEIDLFEGQYQVPNGMSYNSYMIIDEKITIMDTIDKAKTQEWLNNIEENLQSKLPTYIVISHMEPDHSASLYEFLKKYPDTIVVGNKKTFVMIDNFYRGMSYQRLEVCDKGILNIGKHELTFVFTPMVHWPEVMMSYLNIENILFSADAFGKFGALDDKSPWIEEGRRYYIGIVGKYGVPVQAALKKLGGVDIKAICPLHGPVLDNNLGYYLDLYTKWSTYTPEDSGVCICYTSVYGNTKKAVEVMYDYLNTLGINVVMYDLSRADMSKCISEAFKYKNLVLASPTYNCTIFPFMHTFIEGLLERNYQSRNLILVENGSWCPMANKVMKELFKDSKNINILEEFTVNSTIDEAYNEKIKSLKNLVI